LPGAVATAMIGNFLVIIAVYFLQAFMRHANYLAGFFPNI
jgi:hypothetical protein